MGLHTHEFSACVTISRLKLRISAILVSSIDFFGEVLEGVEKKLTISPTMHNQIRFNAKNILDNKFDDENAVLETNDEEYEVDHIPIECKVNPNIICTTVIMVFVALEYWVPFIICKVILHSQACKYKLCTVGNDSHLSHDVKAGHPVSDASSYLGFGPSKVFEVQDLCLDLHMVRDHGEKRCKREDLSEHNDVTKLDDELHVAFHDIEIVFHQEKVADSLVQSPSCHLIFQAILVFFDARYLVAVIDDIGFLLLGFHERFVARLSVYLIYALRSKRMFNTRPVDFYVLFVGRCCQSHIGRHIIVLIFLEQVCEDLFDSGASLSDHESRFEIFDDILTDLLEEHLHKHELKDFDETLFCQCYQEEWKIEVQEVEHECSDDERVVISGLELEVSVVVVVGHHDFVDTASHHHEKGEPHGVDTIKSEVLILVPQRGRFFHDPLHSICSTLQLIFVVCAIFFVSMVIFLCVNLASCISPLADIFLLDWCHAHNDGVKSSVINHRYGNGHQAAELDENVSESPYSLLLLRNLLLLLSDVIEYPIELEFAGPFIILVHYFTFCLPQKFDDVLLIFPTGFEQGSPESKY